jgi:hypothetical protein
MSIFTSNLGQCLFALAVAGVAACGSGSGSQSKPDARPAAFRDADIYNNDVPIQVLPDCPVSCEDQNPCTTDSCDLDTHLCRNDPATDGTSCVTSDLCSIEAACKSGLCVGTKTKDCTVPSDQCHEEGYCVPTSGLCTYPNSVDHKACDDGNLCTTGDQCMAGVCQAAPIQCGAGATCDPKTGQCPGFPTAIWGFALDPSTATGGYYNSLSRLAVSPMGGVYFTASFANRLDLGAGAISTTSTAQINPDSYDYNVVIARLDPGTGRALWSLSVGDKANQSGSSIAANASDMVLVSGLFSGKMDFGPAPDADAGILSYTDTGSFPEVFLVALKGISGTVVWARPVDLSASGNALGVRTRVAVDPSDGNFVFCATPSKAVADFGQTQAGGKGDALIAKLEAQTGKLLWAKQYPGAGDESCNAVTADGAGRIYFTGHLTQGSSLDLGDGRILTGPVGKNQQAMYVAQVSGTDGAALWGKQFYNQGSTTGQITSDAIVTDGSSVWIGGWFTSVAAFETTVLPKATESTDLDAGSLSGASGQTAFVLALDSTDGSALWAKNWGAGAEVTSLALTSSGNLIMGGDYVSGMDVDSGHLPNSPVSSSVPFVAKLTAATGVVQTARGYASSASSSSWFQDIVVDKSGSGTSRDAAYAIGFLGDVVNGVVDLGSPVGQLQIPGVMVDGRASSLQAAMFLVKFNP